MKKLFTILVAVLLTATVWAQAPQKMSYQAVIHNSSNSLVTNMPIGMQISILQGSTSGAAVYVETQTPTTNANGLVSIEIGTGTVVSGDFASIDWANDTYFIKTETDPTGGTSYTITGTSQLLSVPYALHAKTAENGITSDQASEITANTSKLTNVPTALSTGTRNETSYGITSDGGANDLILFEATTDKAGLLSADKWDEIVANTAKVGYTEALVSANTDVAANTAKVGISSEQASEIITNTAKVSAAAGTQAGQMQYWNGTAWVTVAAGSTGQKLTNVNGVPIWINNDAMTDPVSGQIWSDVTSTTGEIWMDRNLGATQVATSIGDVASLGDLYQWGRGTDGHQLRTSGWTSTSSDTDEPGHGDFIVTPGSPYDWRSPENTNLWQGVDGINNPCPDGYRLPNEAELTAERASWGSDNVLGAFASPLKFPAAGMRYSFGETGPVDVGVYGAYWTSTVDGNDSRELIFTSTYASWQSNNRSKGFSVRCIKD